jgi:hypothetical protein
VGAGAIKDSRGSTRMRLRGGSVKGPRPKVGLLQDNGEIGHISSYIEFS